MSINALFKKHPLAIALQVPVVSFLMLTTPLVEARSELHPGMERTIEQGHRDGFAPTKPDTNSLLNWCCRQAPELPR
ncbi:hypothetical protein FQ186_28575 [Pseudomonas sp. ANT_H14]|uniref:hypothetical protein n=1 Tax=unclassified Pseudomonas TaxID=196821 RepID=UPI0011EC8EA7|nr:MULTISPECIES: hypothetical protein [unclassified Pseudomonas]KAA0941185.1 hypothetical protein FQ182_29215 [Pseudomonas sp. ANT_H4]KAA0945309.1 hypothetical protein FQ186_28575 [Pseudomonas sp. ANT_H14]